MTIVADRRTAIEILTAALPDRPPVDVEKIARDLGLRVVRAGLGGAVAGKIARDGAQKPAAGFTVYINEADNPRRQRFTLAHEIAHYMMHRDLIGDGITDDAMYRSTLGDVYERQANRMAASILMPADMVRSVFREMLTIPQLANAFDVSAEAMSIRLRELRLTP